MSDFQISKIWLTVGVPGFLFGLITFFLPSGTTSGWMTGYLLGLMVIVFHYGMSLRIKRFPSKKFNRYFFGGIFVRFIMICALFTLILVYTKIDEAGFTVSFIISYIYHSVIEVILVNQRISNQSDKIAG